MFSSLSWGLHAPRGQTPLYCLCLVQTVHAVCFDIPNPGLCHCPLVELSPLLFSFGQVSRPSQLWETIPGDPQGRLWSPCSCRVTVQMFINSWLWWWQRSCGNHEVRVTWVQILLLVCNYERITQTPGASLSLLVGGETSITTSKCCLEESVRVLSTLLSAWNTQVTFSDSKMNEWIKFLSSWLEILIERTEDTLFSVPPFLSLFF